MRRLATMQGRTTEDLSSPILNFLLLLSDIAEAPFFFLLLNQCQSPPFPVPVSVYTHHPV